VTDDQGRLLRPLDLDFDQLLADLDAKAWRATKRGTAIAFGVGLIALLQITSPVVGAVLFIGQLFWIRLAVIAPFRRYFSPGRRLITRWLSRIVILHLAGLHIPAGFAPFGLGPVIVGPVLFGGLCLLASTYHRYHLKQERARAPISLLEKTLLVIAVIVAVVVLVVVVALTVGVAAVISWLQGG